MLDVHVHHPHAFSGSLLVTCGQHGYIHTPVDPLVDTPVDTQLNTLVDTLVATPVDTPVDISADTPLDTTANTYPPAVALPSKVRCGNHQSQHMFVIQCNTV